MKYAFLGAGKMACAMIEGMLRSQVCKPSDIMAACPDPELLARLRDATSVNVVTSNTEASVLASTVLLCVKPADVREAITQAGTAIDGKLLISIVAGSPIATLTALVPKARIIRAMPNVAAMVARSATAYACAKSVTPGDRSIAEAIFSSIGAAFSVEEKMLNAVTGLSGSGPAYIYLIIEALSDGGVACGLPRKLALDLAVQTVLGTAAMVAETSKHPAILREMVTSPAGTTLAGLRQLEAHAVRSAFLEAVSAGTERAQEISDE